MAALLAAPVIASTASGQETTDCPDAVPVSQLNDASAGVGVTVADGRTREEFTWRYLGLLEDALGPGRDLIIVDTAGPVIDRHNGIFFGMSGSPLYLGDDLVGAIAYGLSAGPSSLAGVTPGEDIMRVMNYPPAEEDDPAPPARSVPLSWSMRTKIAEERSMQPGEVGSSFRQLRVPFGVSGVGGPGIEKITKVAERERLGLIPHAAASANGDEATGEPPQPGDNVSAVLSYGDVTFAGTGTVTVTCEGKFVAFGHPFFWDGETTFAGHAAETITVVEDTTFGSYELANVAEQTSRIDQDRLAGIRGFMGMTTETIPITSSVSAAETGQSRDGVTTVVDQEPVPFTAWYHLYSNILVAMDEYSGGSSSGSFRITGVSEDGTQWELSRSNVYASEWGIAGESSYELEIFLHTLLNNPFEEVEFTSVDADMAVQAEDTSYEVSDVHVSTDGRNFEDSKRVRASRGDTVYMRVLLLPGEDEEEIPVDLEVRIPRRARGENIIEISAPRLYDERVCFFRPQRCTTANGDKVDSLSELLEILETRPTNNELRAQLRIGDRRPEAARDQELLDQVVTGRVRVRVRVSGGGGGGGRGGTETGGGVTHEQ